MVGLGKKIEQTDVPDQKSAPFRARPAEVGQISGKGDRIAGYIDYLSGAAGQEVSYDRFSQTGSGGIHDHGIDRCPTHPDPSLHALGMEAMLRSQNIFSGQIHGQRISIHGNHLFAGFGKEASEQPDPAVQVLLPAPAQTISHLSDQLRKCCEIALKEGLRAAADRPIRHGDDRFRGSVPRSAT
jgi:hypothetical protein